MHLAQRADARPRTRGALIPSGGASPIFHVQQAAVQAGQAAVTVSLPFDLQEGVRPARPEDGLPELPEVSLLLLKARELRQPVTDALHASILDSFEVKRHAL